MQLGLSLGLTRGGGQTLIQRAIASLRARGSDAHLWLPGIGTVSGLTTGNYLESTGNTLATVDNPTGLVLDALGSVGVELVTNGGFDADSGWTKGAGVTISSGFANFAAVTNTVALYQNAGLAASKTYRITFTISSVSAGSIAPQLNGGANVLSSEVSAIGTYTAYLSNSASNGIVSFIAADFTGSIDNISVREVSGIHLTQSTTANKGLLKQDAGSRYYWLFDATDLLTGTFPAGYESVTVIDAKSTGQVTTSAANVVGSYSIGPSYSSYGRIIIKGSITASELALLQSFANRLAGL